ncbi:MAG: metallophosphoesterase family protein [Myxococcota bacterium]
MLRKFLVVWSLLALLAPAATASAPKFVRVSWTDIDTARTAAVTWNTDSLADPSTIEYGTTKSYGQTAEGTAFKANGSLGIIHEVSLTGLEPSTTYHYRVGGAGVWSAPSTFRTGPKDGCEPMRFVALGDNRSDDDKGASPHWNPILNEALAKEPAFILNTGDLVRDGAKDAQWLHFLEATGAGVAHTPLMPSIGNHDDDKVEGDAATYNQIFSLPRNEDTGSEDYYFFIHGDAIFAAISSVTFTGGSTKFAEQAAWLDKVFTEHPKKWKFVFFHYPPYTGSIDFFGLAELAHPSNEQGQNAALVPIFDKHHVDIVFNGHNHFYQRFEPMCCGGASDNGNPTGDPETGTTYIVTGGAGALTYDLSILNLDLCPILNLKKGAVACSGLHHFVSVDIDGLDLVGRVYSTANQLLGADPKNVKLIDEFEIHKSGPAPKCDAPVADPGPDAGGPADAGPTDVADTTSPDAGAEVVDSPDTIEEIADTADAAPSEVGPTDTASETTVAPDTTQPTPDTTPTADLPAPTPDHGGTIPGTGDAVISTPDTTTGAETKSETSSGCAGGGGPTDPWAGLALGLLALGASLRRRRALA